MFYQMYIFFVFFVSFSATQPFIMEELLDNCFYKGPDGTNTSFTSKLWMVENDSIIIYYTLCGYIPDNINCGKKVTACLKNKHDNSIHIIENKFIIDNEDSFQFSLKSVNGTSCKYLPQKKFKLTLKFQCSDQMKRVNLQRINDCEYEIYMLTPTCQPPCTTRIKQEILDIRPLRNNFFINSDERNFSITLCGANKFCKESDVSSCEVLNNTISPLSKIPNEITYFDEEENQLKIHGSYKDPTNKQSGHKIFDLTIKCNWTGTNNITYKKLPKQGKHYSFEMESIYGCVKLPSNCVIKDTFFTYNLTNLYNNRGYYEISNIPNGKMYLNICGPLRLEHNKTEDLCSSYFSQVCEIREGSYINRGSIFTKFKLEDNVIKTTVTSGGKCIEDPSRQYSTHISIFCSKTEEVPKFVRSESCEIFINWHTSHACPVYDETSCQYIHKEYQNCLVEFQENVYDLRPLTLNSSSYEIEDPKNTSIKYLLNVCGPVTDPAVPCMKDSMILMKDLNETNLKFRYKSLGKMNEIVVSNKMVLINTLGSYCGEEGDYSSVIYFICSSTQEGLPRLVNRTACNFQFEWKTPYVCVKEKPKTLKEQVTQNSHTISTDNKPSCLFQEKNMSLNFNQMKETAVKIKELNKTYIFNICKDDYTECIQENEKCQHFSVQKKLMSIESYTYIEIRLPKKCQSRTDFNRLLFKLVCDDIVHNEHFKVGEVDNCTFSIDFSTSLICSAQVASVKEYVNKREYDKYEVVTEKILKKAENCSVSNHFTGYRFYVDDLQLQVPILHCPKVNFNYEKSLVTLTYSGNTCKETNGSGTYDYIILLKCSKQDLHNTKKTKCSESNIFERLQFCKLFEESIIIDSKKSSSTGLIISSIFGVLVVLGIVIYCVVKHKKRFSRPTYRAYENIEDKDL